MADTLNIEKLYKEKISRDLAQKLGGMNIHAIPCLTKIVLNVGVGKIVNTRKTGTTEQKTDEELVDDIAQGLAHISGQRPHAIRAKKSISGFKLREGTVVGLRATLRGKKMYDFLARLIHVDLPRTRDFRGIPLKSVDGHGNITIGIKEAGIFPELPPSNFTWGFEITLVTSTDNKEEALELLKELGIPFKKES